MPNYIIGVPNSTDLANFIGKKGSENSITFYNRTYNGNVMTALEPSSVEEKFYAVLEILTLSDLVILSTDYMDRYFGELAIACGLLGKKVFVPEGNDPSQIFEGAGLKGYEICEKEKLLDKIVNFSKEVNKDSGCRIDIDKSFNVKGIGAVALGLVRSGTVNVHDELYHTSGQLVQVRSLQSQDIDIKSAGPGTRIGIGMKGIEPEQVDKGTILSKDKNTFCKKLKVSFIKSKINEEQLETGKFYGFGSGFSFSSAKVDEIKGNEMTLTLEKRLAIFKGDDFLLLREKSPRMFASGKVIEIIP